MQIAQLRALRELGDRGSIAAVAAAMRVTPSSVSQQLAALQRGITVPLTEKVGRRTALTAAGRALSAAMVDVEIALARADESVGRFHLEAAGDVTVAAFTSAALALFDPLLREPSRAGIPISVSDHDVRQDAFPVLALDHDIVIAHRLHGSPAWPSSLVVVPLMDEPLDIAMRADHVLSRDDSISAAKLRGVEWVAVHDGFPLEGAIEALSMITGVSADVRHRVNDFVVAASVVAATDCVTLLPRHLAAESRRPGVQLRPTSGFSITRSIDILARPETLHRRTVQTVVREIQSVFIQLAR